MLFVFNDFISLTLKTSFLCALFKKKLALLFIKTKNNFNNDNKNNII